MSSSSQKKGKASALATQGDKDARARPTSNDHALTYSMRDIERPRLIARLNRKPCRDRGCDHGAGYNGCCRPFDASGHNDGCCKARGRTAHGRMGSRVDMTQMMRLCARDDIRTLGSSEETICACASPITGSIHQFFCKWWAAYRNHNDISRESAWSRPARGVRHRACRRKRR